jgi:structure-specific recognition protein 1
MGRPSKGGASPKKSKKAAKGGGSSSPKKAKRAKKDPNAPKRAQSAYMIWLAENRSRITKPGMGVTDVAKKAGEEWRKLGDKSKWEKQAAKEKERYDREMSAYKKKSPKK